MTFVNLQVNLDDLPSAAELEMEPMAPAYESEVKAQLAMVFLPWLLISFVPLLFSQHRVLLFIPLLILLIAVVVSWLAIRRSRIKGFAMREHDVAYRSGLFWRKTVVIALNRIQHVEVGSGPLQRKYGLASLKFFTAGGSGVDLKVDGLTRESAEQVRAFIMKKNTGESGD